MKLLITESQLTELKNFQIIEELTISLNEGNNLKIWVNKIKAALVAGVSAAAIIAAISKSNISSQEKEALAKIVQTEMVGPEQPIVKPAAWKLLASDVTATVYHAVPSQCDADVQHTASMFKLNLDDVASHRIIAMERTMMSEFGLKYGDVVKIKGTGKYDGVWQIQDTMNKRFAGQHKIDILVPQSAGLGIWKNVKVYKLADKSKAEHYLSQMQSSL